jgi:hypothetical protein
MTLLEGPREGQFLMGEVPLYSQALRHDDGDHDAGVSESLRRSRPENKATLAVYAQALATLLPLLLCCSQCWRGVTQTAKGHPARFDNETQRRMASFRAKGVD